jgi:hypothetical protein
MTPVNLRMAAVLACGLALAACGGNSDSDSAGAGSSTPAAADSQSGSVSPQVIANCAGITREKAAALLGVDASLLTDYSRTEGKLRNCVYTMAAQRRNTVAFTLSLKASESAAKASLNRERESMSMAQGAIDGVTGSKSAQPAAQNVSAGDEAFFSPVNGALTMRVRNVIAIVTSPQDAERKARVADAIAEGLRQ